MISETFCKIAEMPPLDATPDAARDVGPDADLPITSDDAPSPLSERQIAALIRTVVGTLARGQSVTVMSEGRMLARYHPNPASSPVAAAEDESDAAR